MHQGSNSHIMLNSSHLLHGYIKTPPHGTFAVVICLLHEYETQYLRHLV